MQKSSPDSKFSSIEHIMVIVNKAVSKSVANGGKDAQGRINCRECQYFFVTWQVSAPYGCKAHGFKSAQIPSMVVFSSSGQHCLLFRQRVHQT